MKFYGELTILTLLLITNGRIFFLKKTNLDPVVILAPISLFLSLLQIAAWNIDFFTLTTLVLSILVSLSNFHALFRYSEQVYIDHYSPLMYFWGILTGIISTVLLFLLIFYSPVELRKEKLGIEEEKILLTGNFKSGFQKSSAFDIPDGTLYTFKKIKEADEQTEQKPSIIFFADKTGDTLMYKPYLQLLSLQGYDVYSADFFSKDCRWLHSGGDSKYTRRIIMAIQKVAAPQKFSMNREFYNYNILQECNAMVTLLSSQEFNTKNDTEEASCKKFILITDTMGINAAKDYANQHPQKIQTVISLASLNSYTTQGFGTIAQTDPLLAQVLQGKIPLERKTRYQMNEINQMIQETINLIPQETKTEATDESL